MKNLILILITVATFYSCRQPTIDPVKSVHSNKYVPSAPPKYLTDMYRKAGQFGKSDPVYFLDQNGDTIYEFRITALAADTMFVGVYDDGGSLYWPFQDCFGDWFISREEVMYTTQPQWQWVHNLTDSGAFCFPQ